MTENHELAVGSNLTRREMLRRSAALGAAVAVATPVAQGLGRISAFAQVTPEPSPSPSPSPEPNGRPSHFQILVLFDNELVGLKYDEEGWDRIPPAPACFTDYNEWPQDVAYNGTNLLQAFRDGGFVTTTHDAFILTGLPEGVTYVDGVAFDGSFQEDPTPGAVHDKCGPSVPFNGEAVFTT